MRRLLLLALAAQASACLVDNPLYNASATDVDSGGGTGTGAAATATTAASSQGGTETGTTAAAGSQGGTESGSAGTTSAAATGVTASTTLDDATTGVPDIPSYPDLFSCLEVLEELADNGREHPSGLYEIRSGNGTVVVYCDMETANGGWTLVGRSVAGGAGDNFGWWDERGDVLDDAQPYSLNVALHPIPFAEILIGEYATGKAWGDHLYGVAAVPSDFVMSYTDKTTALTYKGKLGASPCDPSSVQMLAEGGFTDLINVFHFTNANFVCGDDSGLRVDGFLFHDPNYCDIPFTCQVSGLLHGKQGMIMVR